MLKSSYFVITYKLLLIYWCLVSIYYVSFTAILAVMTTVTFFFYQFIISVLFSFCVITYKLLLIHYSSSVLIFLTSIFFLCELLNQCSFGKNLFSVLLKVCLHT